ncbi:MAG: PIN domain-containing protein [Gemmatimonadota bacterium]|nr:MAG: PIN domain-containing protein [Gemmatimonadota bacterium]
MKTWLADTGPLVAYLDAGDPSHVQVATRLGEFSGALVTTSAVITEAMHLLQVSRDGPHTLAEFVAASGMAVYDLCRPPELHEAVLLMEKYADTPMDFADATLVLLAEGLDVREVLTLDRRGFSTYRTRLQRHFRLVLDETS